MLVIPLFGLDKANKDMESYQDDVYGIPMSWESGLIRTISLYGVPAGTSTFLVWFRYNNGRGWLDYQALQQNDSDLTTEFGSGTNYDGKILQFNIDLQPWVLSAMPGGQIWIQRNTGSGAIAFTKGYASVE